MFHHFFTVIPNSSKQHSFENIGTDSGSDENISTSKNMAYSVYGNNQNSKYLNIILKTFAILAI